MTRTPTCVYCAVAKLLSNNGTVAGGRALPAAFAKTVCEARGEYFATRLPWLCSHIVTASAEEWPDDIRLSDIEGRYTCSVCGHRGADIRSDWQSKK